MSRDSQVKRQGKGVGHVIKQRKSLCRQRTVLFSMSGVWSEGGRGREGQVVVGEVIRSHAMKDLNEQC